MYLLLYYIILYYNSITDIVQLYRIWSDTSPRGEIVAIIYCCNIYIFIDFSAVKTEVRMIGVPSTEDIPEK